MGAGAHSSRYLMREVPLRWAQHGWEDEAEAKRNLVGTTVALFGSASYFTCELIAK